MIACVFCWPVCCENLRIERSISFLITRTPVTMIPAWIGVFFVLLTTNADPDLWEHLRFGLDALAAHGLTTIDPYSYTSDIPWLNHEWLSEVVIAAAYQAFGSAGLVATKMTFIIATFALLAPVLRRAPELWRWPSTLLTVLGVTPIALTVRPQLWTMLFVVVLCRALNAAPSRRWFLPFAFAVWANVHGGWIVGVGVLWLWSTVEGVTGAKERPSLWITLGVPAACTLATLVNPYGVRLWIFIAETVRLSRANIIEWQPVWRDSIWMALLWLLAVGWTALAIRRASVRRPQAIAVIEQRRDAIGYGELVHDDAVAKVSIVGVGIRSNPSLASKMFETLAERQINLLAVSSSEIKVSALIAEAELDLAVRVLHTAFGLDTDA